MITEKLSTADAFVVVDLPDAEFHSGVVRCAKKILHDGAVNLARATTYSYALFGRRAAGLSGGINAIGDGRDAAVAAAVSELAASEHASSRRIEAAKGLTPEEMAPLHAAGDPMADDLAALDAATARSAVAAAVAARAASDAAPLTDSDVWVEETPLAAAIVTALDAVGATASVTADLPETADVMFVGSKPGVIAHDTLDNAPQLIVPSGPLPVSARGLATLERAGTIVLPDLLTLAAPLLVRAPIDSLSLDDALDAVAEMTTHVVAHERGAYLGSCIMAEAEIDKWAPALPAARPIA